METKTWTVASTVASVATIAVALGLTTSLPFIFALMISIAVASVTTAVIASASVRTAPLALHRTAPRRRALVG